MGEGERLISEMRAARDIDPTLMEGPNPLGDQLAAWAVDETAWILSDTLNALTGAEDKDMERYHEFGDRVASRLNAYTQGEAHVIMNGLAYQLAVMYRKAHGPVGGSFKDLHEATKNANMDDPLYRLMKES